MAQILGKKVGEGLWAARQGQGLGSCTTQGDGRDEMLHLPLLLPRQMAFLSPHSFSARLHATAPARAPGWYPHLLCCSCSDKQVRAPEHVNIFMRFLSVCCYCAGGSQGCNEVAVCDMGRQRSPLPWPLITFGFLLKPPPYTRCARLCLSISLEKSSSEASLWRSHL